MKITDKLNKETIIFLNQESRSNIIKELLDQLVTYNYLEKSIELFSFINSKESENSSNIGRGIAFPHSTSKELKDLVCILGISKDGIHYDEDDVHPCHIVLLSLSPNNNPDIHRKFISKFQLLTMDPILKQKIISANFIKDIEKLLIDWEIKQIEEEL
tara:strand:+ start:81 stop:554 length:474 start_codon:yes stop_codon:yes gene_type:complete